MNEDRGTQDGQGASRLRVRALPQDRGTAFDWRPDAAGRAALTESSGAAAARKVRLAGTLTPVSGGDWLLEGMLGATAVQACVVTGDPVTTRIDAPVRLLYRRAVEDAGGAGEIEMRDGAEEEEPLPDVIDLEAVAAEALALALPDFPRSPEAGPGNAMAAPPGAAPLTDDAVKPFAGLADLKARMEGGE